MMTRVWLPTWLRIAIVGALWTAGMLFLKATRGERIGWEGILVWLVFGGLFGAIQVRLHRAQMARFDPIDGPPLSSAERAAAMAALRAGQPPPDPRVADAARDMAQAVVDQPVGRTALLILLLGFAAAASAMAIWDHPIWWIYVVALLVLTPFTVRAERRGREAALRYLASVEGRARPTPSSS